MLPRVLCARFILDFAAFLHLLISGKLDNARAVMRAESDFMRMRSSYRLSRAQNLQKTIVPCIKQQFDGSILYNYYLKGKKTYQSIFDRNHK
jgi:hypothetical protein